MAELREWETFYVILGSAAAALIGLQFVVLTLIAERPPADAPAAGAAFATPTIVHFGVTLLLSTLACAPWQTMTLATVAWGIVGAAGAGYAFVVARRMRLQKAYQPQLEDWLYNVLFPLMAYVVLLVSAFMGNAHTREALFGVGGAALGLLFVGIHNAWDAVSYHVFVHRQKNQD